MVVCSENSLACYTDKNGQIRLYADPPKHCSVSMASVMNINRFFTDTLGAQLKNPRWSWGATDPLNYRVYLRVWQDGIQETPSGERIQIARDKPRRQSNGFAERHAHVGLIRDGAEGFGVVCTAVDPDTTDARQIASFDSQFLIRFGRITKEGGNTYAEIVERVPVDEVAQQKTAESTLTEDLRAINRQKIDTTTKEALVNARVGQGLFRSRVLTMWENCCAVTGSKTKDAIRASHIKPWRNSSNEERLDPNNGLPLIGSLDALFDAGLISFDVGGTMLVSPRLSRTERSIFSVDDRRLLKSPTNATADFLAYHRDNILRK